MVQVVRVGLLAVLLGVLLAACERASASPPVATAPKEQSAPAPQPVHHDPKPKIESTPPVERTEPQTEPTPQPQPQPQPVLTQDGTGKALVFRRAVKLRITDAVNKETEVHRKETVTLTKDRLRIEDETFGTLLIVRLDKGAVYRADLMMGTYSEATLEHVAQRRRAFLADVREWRKRVDGTDDAKELDRILLGFQDIDIQSVDLRATGQQATIANRAATERQLIINSNIECFRYFIDESLPQGEWYFDILARLGCFNERVAEKLRGVKGLPLKGRLRASWFLERITSEEEVLSIEQKDVDDAVFELPKDLKTKIHFAGVDDPPRRQIAKPSQVKRGFEEDDIEEQQNPFREKKEEKEKDKPNPK